MVRTRFAPSPTGYLHIGGLRTALYAYLYAKKNGGKFILRIEDTDTERFVEGATDIIYRTLKDAGLKYDEGPDVGGEFGPYVQSERKDTYIKYAERLVKNGGAYYCFCSKERLEKLRESGQTKYDKHCESLTSAEAEERIKNGEACVIRQKLPLKGSSTYTDMVFGDITIENDVLDDGILIKSDGMPTYNFANVIDDYLMGITHVIRGVEYLDQTAKYNFIYKGLGWEPPQYMHLQPIMRDSRHKLSKRHGDASYEDFIKKGFLREAVVNYIALLGFSPGGNIEKMTLEEMVGLFSVEGLSKSQSIFDIDKMTWLNSLYIRELPFDEFFIRAKPFLEGTEHLKGYDLEFAARLVQSRCELLSSVSPLTGFLKDFENFDLNFFVNEKWKTDLKLAKTVLGELIVITQEKFDGVLEEIENFAAEGGYKKGQILWIYRIALTGALVTPGGALEMLKLLGKERALERLKKTFTRL
jgi:glutamyl-tRNA synthetase